MTNPKALKEDWARGKRNRSKTISQDKSPTLWTITRTRESKERGPSYGRQGTLLWRIQAIPLSHSDTNTSNNCKPPTVRCWLQQPEHRIWMRSHAINTTDYMKIGPDTLLSSLLVLIYIKNYAIYPMLAIASTGEHTLSLAEPLGIKEKHRSEQWEKR